MFGESYADQIKSITLADNTVARRISDISDDLCDQLIEKIKLSSFALQVDEDTDVAKDAHLITYIRYVIENDIREELLFCCCYSVRAIEGKATASEVFNMIDNFFIANGILWENCVGLCTDGAPSMAGKNAGLQAPVRKVAPRAVWTHCMIYRQSFVARNMGEELLEDWLQVKDFPTLTNKALEILLPFVTSCLCETGFSAVAVLKTKVPISFV
ncbi:zinc finger BED domain-containing protein 5-like [Ctenocephalides felis]|uniref:zinc finger BED domain-containing protein 5-like n=1 Tax=Ctenocephalides felis TaxID=7515 RepID=UPI000E6E3346|nr:zinc finger BED domain-containing protein 5-like [Ctenocephalides felis]